MKKKHTISVQILVFVVLGGGIIAAGGLLYRSQRDSCLTEAEYKLAAIVDLKVGELSAWRKARLSEYDHKIYLRLFAPIIDVSSDGKPLGVVVLWIDPNVYLYPLIQRWPTPSETAETLLICREGNEVVFLNELKFQKNTALALRESLDDTDLPAVKAVLGQEGIVEGIDYRGVPVLAAVLAVPNSPWFLVARMDLAEVYAPMRKWLWLTVLFVGVLLFGTAAAAWFFWWRRHAALCRQKYEAEHKYRNLVESSRDAIMTIEPPSWKFTYGNPATVQMFRLKNARELTTLEPWKLSPERQPDGRDSGEKSKEMIEMGLREGSHFFEWTHKRIDGEEFPATVLMTRMEQAGKVFVQGTVRDISEQKRAEEALRESESLHRAIFENMLAGCCVDEVIYENGRAVDYRIIDVNPAFERITGIPRSRAAGALASVLYGTGQAPFLDVFSKVAESGEPVAFDAYFAPIEKHLHVTVGCPGKGRFSAVINDITDHKRAEEALQHERDFAEALVETAQTIVLVLDPDGHIIRFNPYMEEISGYRLEEVRGKDWFSTFLPQHDAESVRALFLKAIGDIHTHGNVNAIITKDGSRREIEWYDKTLKDTHGSTVGLLAIGQDVTERKRVEEALRESECYYRELIDSAADAIFVHDVPSGNIIDCNRRAYESLGYSREEVLRLSVRHIDASFSQERDVAVWEELKPGMSTRIEGFHKRKDHSVFPVEVNIVVISRAGRNLAIAVARDITDRKRAEQELIQTSHAAEAANRAKSEFLANMSHEIRTPMTAILGYADLMLDENVGRTTREHVVVIKRNSEHLLGLISGILDLSKIEAEKLQIEPTRCSPAQLVAEVASLMRPQAAAKQLALKTELAPSLPETVLTDPLRLRQILVNLVGNAIKFTDQGEVRLAVRLNADSGRLSLCFDVTDTGIGMNEEQIGKLFKPFSQVDSSSTRKFGGTGLGLCISKNLAEALGGSIEVRSQPGKGSTFSLMIDPGPLDGMQMMPNAQESMLDSLPTTTAAASEKIVLHGRILLAEDGLDNQRLVSLLLRTAGAVVSAVENGQLAVEAALAAREAGEPFDLLLMDMQMPVMDGYEATRKLRKLDYTGNIVALTGHAMAADCQKCLDAGCNDYLSKPFQMSDLLKMAARHITVEKEGKPVYSHPTADPGLGKPQATKSH